MRFPSRASAPDALEFDYICHDLPFLLSASSLSFSLSPSLRFPFVYPVNPLALQVRARATRVLNPHVARQIDLVREMSRETKINRWVESTASIVAGFFDFDARYAASVIDGDNAKGSTLVKEITSPSKRQSSRPGRPSRM